MQVGDVLLILALSYGMGVLWYELLPAKIPMQVWRVMAYPFVAIVIGEAFLASYLTFDVTFGAIHVFTALVSTLVGVIVDWTITEARRPALVAKLEPGPA